jgi:P27 family predicted phage terminase small subunit
MAGRPPIPIKVLQANGRKHLTKAEIEKRTSTEDNLKPAANKVKYPEWLDDKAKQEWRRIISELKKLELVTNIDVAALAICCDAYSKYVKATSDINKVGLLVSYTNKGGNKNVSSNPLINIATKYSEIYKKYCNEFGLTPNSRIKLTVNKEFEKEDPLTAKGFGNV